MQNNFEIYVLGSGSKGNATLIKTRDTAVLIDAGISCRRIVEGLRGAGLEPADLNGIFLTHEHIDHVAGLTVLSKQLPKVPIYANEKTWGKLKLRRELPLAQKRVLPRGFTLGNIKIVSFKISHDAIDPVGYELFYGKEKCTYLTDSGYVTERCRQALEGASTAILEANHDVEMLVHGPYPKILQDRILGKWGHLSNLTAGKILAQLAAPPGEVFLAHLSEKNNAPALAFKTVQDCWRQEHGNEALQIYVTRQNSVVSNK